MQHAGRTPHLPPRSGCSRALPARRAPFFVLLFTLSFCVSCSQAGEAAPVEIRAIWVTRWDYRTPDDIRAIVRNAASYGFNRLYFQVRGEGTCFFPSKVEPWAWELSGNIPQTGKNPGWDPLAYAIAQAHRGGLELHAYLNVLPGWNQDEPPPRSSGHPFVTHPEWHMVDSAGRRMTPRTHKFYAFLNPARSDVRAHLVRVFADVAGRYRNLDGIHLDYIRYPGEAGEFSYDPVTISEFKKHSRGLSPAQAPGLWNQYRCYLIDLLLAEITRGIRKANPRLEISAATIANYESSVKTKSQKWLDWPTRHYVDTVVPMAYHYDMRVYAGFLETCLGKSGPGPDKVIVGIWPAKKWEKEGLTPRRMAEQVLLARKRGAAGVALFSYSEFFPGHKPNRWATYLKTYCFSSR